MRRWVPKRWWTRRYVYDRARQIIDQRRHPSDPWLCRQAVLILQDWLRPSDVMAEFGSGRSTPWFAHRVGHLTSVENDPSWYQRVKPALADLPVDHRLCRDESAYVGVARGFQAASLDVALVDGAWRDQCALAMQTALRPGGLLVIDNVNWYLPSPGTRSPSALQHHTARWDQFGESVRPWRRIWVSDGVNDTGLFVKPAR